jgi:hypothetical protein
MLQSPLSCIPDCMSPLMPGYLLTAMPPKRSPSTQSNYRHGTLLLGLRFAGAAARTSGFLNAETAAI